MSSVRLLIGCTNCSLGDTIRGDHLNGGKEVRYGTKRV